MGDICVHGDHNRNQPRNKDTSIEDEATRRSWVSLDANSVRKKMINNNDCSNWSEDRDLETNE